MTKITAPVPPGGPPPMRSQLLADWSGGLNLGADDFQLQVNETPDALDIDPSPLGGVVRRASFRGLLTTGMLTTEKLKFLFHWASNENDNGTIIVGGQSAASTDKVAYWATGDISDGHAKTNIRAMDSTQSTLGHTWSGALMKPLVGGAGEQALYMHRDYLSKAIQFQADNLIHTEMTDAYGNYNDDITTPTGGKMPKAEIMCQHLVYMFHADTYENSIRREARIRWSHPGSPGDYRTDDYVDVGEGGDGDRIKALVSWQQNLFIFKERSVWVMSGYDVDTFAFTRLAANLGVPNKNCAVSAKNGVYFYDEFLGVFQITGGNGSFDIQPLWNKLNPAIDDGRISNGQFACMAVAGSKLYVSGLKWRSASKPNRTFVFDIDLRDGWWAYSVGFDLLACYTASTGEKHIMGAGPFTNRGGASTTYLDFICIQQQLSTDVDDRFNGATEVTYTGSFTTAWIDGGDPALKKRFRRFSMVFDNMASTSPFTVLGYRNWSNTTPAARTFTVAGTADPSAADFGTQISKRGGALGSGFSAAVNITGPNDKAWGLNAVMFRFIPQRVI